MWCRGVGGKRQGRDICRPGKQEGVRELSILRKLVFKQKVLLTKM